MTTTQFEVSLPWCSANNRFHPEILNPAAHGIDEVLFSPGDYSKWPLSPVSGARFIGSQAVKIIGGMIQGVENISFEGFDLLGGFEFRESWTNPQRLCKDVRLTNITCSQHLYSPLRFRFGTTGIKIKGCKGHRVGPLKTTGDVVFLYFSDYGKALASQSNLFLPCNFEIEDCEMSGYSDFVQTGAPRNGIDWGCYAGSSIRNCRSWVRPEHYVDGGKRMSPGLEQLMLDAKDDGTPEDPMIVDGFTCYGSRPALLANGGTPGYVTTIHRRGHIDFRNVRLIDCVGGIMQKQADCAATYENIDVFRMDGHDPAFNPWPTKNDTLFCGQGPARVKRLRCRGLGKMTEFNNSLSTFEDVAEI